eukprot:2948152-Pyramimonas_sp.AAC.1
MRPSFRRPSVVAHREPYALDVNRCNRLVPTHRWVTPRSNVCNTQSTKYSSRKYVMPHECIWGTSKISGTPAYPVVLSCLKKQTVYGGALPSSSWMSLMSQPTHKRSLCFTPHRCARRGFEMHRPQGRRDSHNDGLLCQATQ